MSNDKNYALELASNAQEFIDADVDIPEDIQDIQDAMIKMLHSQAAALEQLKAELQRVYAVVTSYAKITFKAEDERDQLKAKNEMLVDAVETVCEGFTLHPSARKILETGLYCEALKENT